MTIAIQSVIFKAAIAVKNYQFTKRKDDNAVWSVAVHTLVHTLASDHRIN